MKVAARIGEGLRREIERGRRPRALPQGLQGGRRLAPHSSLLISLKSNPFPGSQANDVHGPLQGGPLRKPGQSTGISFRNAFGPQSRSARAPLRPPKFLSRCTPPEHPPPGRHAQERLHKSTLESHGPPRLNGCFHRRCKSRKGSPGYSLAVLVYRQGLLKIPVWWRRAVLPSLPLGLSVFFLSFWESLCGGGVPSSHPSLELSVFLLSFFLGTGTGALALTQVHNFLHLDQHD